MSENSKNCNGDAMPAGESSKVIVLEIRGLGHVPAFKNKKRAIPTGKKGAYRTLTDPETKRWMDRCAGYFALQLDSHFRITDAGTLTDAQVQSSIASAIPEDDCWTCISDLVLSAQKVEKGYEGAIITIERL